MIAIAFSSIEKCYATFYRFTYQGNRLLFTWMLTAMMVQSHATESHRRNVHGSSVTTQCPPIMNSSHTCKTSIRSPGYIHYCRFRAYRLPGCRSHTKCRTSQYRLPQKTTTVHTMFIVPFFFHFLLHFLHILFSVAKIERNIHTVRTKTTDRNTNFIDRLINLSFQHPISVKKSNFVSTRRIAYE